MWRLTGHRTLKVRATGVEKVLGLAFREGKLYALEHHRRRPDPRGTGAIALPERQGIGSVVTRPSARALGAAAAPRRFTFSCWAAHTLRSSANDMDALMRRFRLEE